LTIAQNRHMPKYPFPIVVALAAILLGLSASSAAIAAERRIKSKIHDHCAEWVLPLVQAKMAELKIPGVILSVQVPGLCHITKAIGLANLDSGSEMDIRDHVRIGSITKTFTGTVILQLRDEGKLKLDDPISRYLEGVPNGDNITIRQLLNMTSGLYNYADDSGLNASLDNDPFKTWMPESLLAIAYNPAHKPNFEPGTDYHYSNTNTVLLGLLVEKLTSHSLELEFKNRLFKPLGLKHTSMPQGGSTAIPEPHPQGYMFASNVGTLDNKCDGNANSRRDVTNMSPSWAWSAGAAISTVKDLQIWAKALATGKLLSPTSQAARVGWVPTTKLPGVPLYGLGIVNFRGWLGHTGAIPGFQSFMGYLPERDATIIVLSNAYPNVECKEVSAEITKAIMNGLFPELTPGLDR
jgi:D-alanyl-D-alanine carboxypeptidase